MDPAFVPSNPLVTVMLNDYYQVTMAYAFWRAGKQFVASSFNRSFTPITLWLVYCM